MASLALAEAHDAAVTAGFADLLARSRTARSALLSAISSKVASILVCGRPAPAAYWASCAGTLPVLHRQLPHFAADVVARLAAGELVGPAVRGLLHRKRLPQPGLRCRVTLGAQAPPKPDEAGDHLPEPNGTGKRPLRPQLLPVSKQNSWPSSIFPRKRFCSPRLALSVAVPSPPFQPARSLPSLPSPCVPSSCGARASLCPCPPAPVASVWCAPELRLQSVCVEVIANGSSLGNGGQLAVDTTIVSPLTAARSRRETARPVALCEVSRRKEATYRTFRQRLVVLGVEGSLLPVFLVSLRVLAPELRRLFALCLDVLMSTSGLACCALQLPLLVRRLLFIQWSARWASRGPHQATQQCPRLTWTQQPLSSPLVIATSSRALSLTAHRCELAGFQACSRTPNGRRHQTTKNGARACWRNAGGARCTCRRARRRSRATASPCHRLPTGIANTRRHCGPGQASSR